MRKSSRVKSVALAFLLVSTVLIWYAAARAHPGVLTVSFLNVGQGDAVYIEAPSGRRVLFDGGPDASVLRELGALVPPWERTLDVVVVGDLLPQHIGGLTDVFERYGAAMIVMPNSQSTTPQANTFNNELASQLKSGTKVITAERGQVIKLGDGAYLEVLFPDRLDADIPASQDLIVARLVYGNTSFLLTGASQGLENYLAMLDGAKLKSDVLLVGGNGAKTSSSPIFVGYVSPQYAIISHGCDVKYAPATQTLATLQQFGAQILDTCADGTITFVSDGEIAVQK